MGFDIDVGTYEADEFQFRSNEFMNIGVRIIKIDFKSEQAGQNEVEAARKYIDFNGIKVIDDDYYKPTIENTVIQEYPKAVVFKADVGQTISVFIQEKILGFIAVSHSK